MRSSAVVLFNDYHRLLGHLCGVFSLELLHSGFYLFHFSIEYFFELKGAGTMKHFIILLVVGLISYGIWLAVASSGQRQSLRFLAKRGVRLAVFFCLWFLFLLGLLLLAYYFPAIALL